MSATVTQLPGRPLYAFGTVDALLGLKPGTSGRWINGYTRSGRTYEPVIRPEPTETLIATWGETVECRLLSEYRTAGVPLVNLRPVVARLRAELRTPYPLAAAQLWLTPSGKEILARAQEGLDRGLWLVRTGEDLLPLGWATPAKRFQQAVHWESSESLVPEYLQIPKHPQVVIDPDRGFGEPVIKGRGVPTRVLSELVAAGDPVEMVAEMYDLEPSQVRAALRYERKAA